MRELSMQHCCCRGSQAPREEPIERDVLVQENGGPKDHLEWNLGGFVSEASLGDKGAGPAAEQGAEMEVDFGDTPLAGLRAPFIAAVGKASGERGDEWNGDDDAPIDRRGESEKRYRGDDEEEKEEKESGEGGAKI